MPASGAPAGAGPAAGPGPAAPTPIAAPVGEVATAIGRRDVIEERAALTVSDILRDSPGVTVRQGNGPRDQVVSIRGNNARATGTLRNMIVLEDGFPVTQADGSSRFDITDPRAYGRIDVFRGPQSALFGNYATGGALAFTTRRRRRDRRRRDRGGCRQLRLPQHLRGRRWHQRPVRIQSVHQRYPRRWFCWSQLFQHPDDQFPRHLHADPGQPLHPEDHRQRPVDRASGPQLAQPVPDKPLPARLCRGAHRRPRLHHVQSVPQRSQRRHRAGHGRRGRLFPRRPAHHHRRRYEHDFDPYTTWRTQLTFDDRQINQPTSATSSRGDFPGFNILTDVTRRADLFGLPATGYIALAYNTLDSHSLTYNRLPYGGVRLGGLTGDLEATQDNLGGRARLELQLSDQWTAVAGISAESTAVTGRNIAYTYPNAGGFTPTLANLDRSFLNVAEELSLTCRPSADWRFLGRVATGYATPSASNLTVSPMGVPGNNAQLQTQENLGFDLGAAWSPLPEVQLSVTGFYEFFRNELIAQSPGAGLLSYTFNAPASEHRGVEIGGTWAAPEGWRATLAYTFDDQIYTRYTEQLSAGTRTARFDRSGRHIPGVPTDQLLFRFGYEQTTGPLKGLGAFVETIYQSDFVLDNANLLKAPGYAIVNLNVRYDTILPGRADAGFAKRLSLYVEVRNLFDRVYAASAQNLADTISGTTGLQNGAGVLAATTGSIFAGAPRNVVGGMKLAFLMAAGSILGAAPDRVAIGAPLGLCSSALSCAGPLAFTAESVPVPGERPCAPSRHALTTARAVALLALLGTGLAVAAHDYAAGALKIGHPWSRATPNGAKVAGGYLSVTNAGTEPDRLTGAALAEAGRAEVHRMSMEGGVMRMGPVEGGLAIGPGETVTLKPGGYHVMFLDLKRQLKQGERVAGTLTFEKAGTVPVEFAVEGLAAKAPEEAHHGH